VTRELHSHTFGDAGPNQIPDRRATEVVRDAPRTAGQAAGGAEGHAKRSDRFACAVEQVRHNPILLALHSVRRSPLL